MLLFIPSYRIILVRMIHSETPPNTLYTVDHTIRLTSYLRQLITHPTLGQDPDLMNFIQDVDVITSEMSLDLKRMFDNVVKKAILFKNK